MVFQSYSSFAWLTVEGNVRFGMRYRTDMSKAQRDERARHYIGLVGLTGFEQSFPNRVSGGMRQRLAIARTLAAGSDLLLMDEPFGALDALRRETLQGELRSIQRAEGKTVIFVTHDVDEAAYLADRVIVFTKRPAAISADVDVTSLLGEDRPAEIRDTPQFIALRRQLGVSVRAAAADEV
jgi:ABC-type nitrate/sulfonate/bicarbonate transport system ATPase subunit